MKISKIQNSYISNLQKQNKIKHIEALKEMEKEIKEKELKETLKKITDEIIAAKKDPQHLIDLLA